MSDDDLEAAWGGVHDATMAGRSSGYDAAMTSPRWCWVLVSMAIVVAGCQPTAGQVPEDFTHLVEFFGGSFRASAPTKGTLPASEAMAIYLDEVIAPPDFMLTRPMGEPVFGVLSCNGGEDCNFAEAGIPRAVWVVLYWAPLGDNDLGQFSAAFHDAWALLDATTGRFIYGSGQ